MLLKRPFFIVYVTLFSLMLVNCISHKKSPAQSQTPSQKQPVPPPSKSLSPGTAKVSAVVLSCIEEEKTFVCEFRIKTVHGYGSATPPLPKGTKIRVDVPKSLFKKSNRSAPQLLKEGNTLKATLSYAEHALGKTASASWRVIRFH